jgi:hypothetical protein
LVEAGAAGGGGAAFDAGVPNIIVWFLGPAGDGARELGAGAPGVKPNTIVCLPPLLG